MIKTAAKIQTKNDKVNYQETEPHCLISGTKINSGALQGCNNGDRRKVKLHSQTRPGKYLTPGLSFFMNGGNQETCQKKSNVRLVSIIKDFFRQQKQVTNSKN
jgi:hypothetical protein